VPFDFSLAISLSLVVAPFTFYHQYVLLLIPPLVVGLRLHEQRSRGLLVLVGVLAIGVGGSQAVWAAAKPFIVDIEPWRLFSLPFLLTMVLRELSFSEVRRLRRRRQAALSQLS
jgi:hypothetical protein